MKQTDSKKTNPVKNSPENNADSVEAVSKKNQPGVEARAVDIKNTKNKAPLENSEQALEKENNTGRSALGGNKNNSSKD